MSKRSYKTCVTEAQKLRWRIKVRKKKLNRSLCTFLSQGCKDPEGEWARMKRCIMVIEDCLVRLGDPKRSEKVNARILKVKKKLEKYEEAARCITHAYGLPFKEVVRSSEYRRTLRKHLKDL